MVVDDSKTDLSREYIRLLNATPQVSVIADGLDYAEAQEWMKEGDAVGILYLPSDSHLLKASGMVTLREVSIRCPQNVLFQTFTDVKGTGVIG